MTDELERALRCPDCHFLVDPDGENALMDDAGLRHRECDPDAVKRTRVWRNVVHFEGQGNG